MPPAAPGGMLGPGHKLLRLPRPAVLRLPRPAAGVLPCWLPSGRQLLLCLRHTLSLSLVCVGLRRRWTKGMLLPGLLLPIHAHPPSRRELSFMLFLAHARPGHHRRHSRGAHHHLNPLNLTRTITLSIHSLTCPTSTTHSLLTISTPIHRPMGCGLVVLASGSLHMPSAAAAPSAGMLLLVWPSVLLSLLLALHLALHLVLALVRLVLATLCRCTWAKTARERKTACASPCVTLHFMRNLYDPLDQMVHMVIAC